MPIVQRTITGKISHAIKNHLLSPVENENNGVVFILSLNIIFFTIITEKKGINMVINANIVNAF